MKEAVEAFELGARRASTGGNGAEMLTRCFRTWAYIMLSFMCLRADASSGCGLTQSRRAGGHARAASSARQTGPPSVVSGPAPLTNSRFPSTLYHTALENPAFSGRAIASVAGVILGCAKGARSSLERRSRAEEGCSRSV